MQRRYEQQKSNYWIAAALGIGAIAGLRAMTAPAVLVWAANQNWIQSPSPRTSFLQNKTAVSIVSALAVSELVVDKLPTTPNRTEPIGLSARILTGGLSAGALCASKKAPVAAGAVLGGLAAVAGAFLGYTTRRQLREKFHLNDTAVAVAEDAIAIGSGVLLVQRA